MTVLAAIRSGALALVLAAASGVALAQPPASEAQPVAATVGASAAAVTLLPKVVEAPAVSDAPALKPPPEKGGGYSLSEHVKRYYKTTSA